MPRPRRAEVRPKDLQGLKYFRPVGPPLDRLHSDATARDHAGNRRLYFDQYAGLLLLTFFNPILTSLRALQQASGLAKVQKRLGCERAALGSLSRGRPRLRPRFAPHASSATWPPRAAPLLHGREAEALPRADRGGWDRPGRPAQNGLGSQRTEERALKMHLQFDVLSACPATHP